MPSTAPLKTQISPTIVVFDDFRRVRPIAENVSESTRIQPYILEAELYDVLPAIGAGAYKKFVEIANGVDTNGDPTKPEIADILYGSYYTDKCGKEQYQDGLVNAIAYLAYARLVRQNSLNVTAFGVVVKYSETSTPASNESIQAVSNQARMSGLAALKRCVAYLTAIGEIGGGCCKAAETKKRVKFRAIGG